MVRPLALEGECLNRRAEAQDLKSGCPHLPMERELVVGFFGPKCESFCHMSLSRVSQVPWPEQVGSTGHRGPGEDPGLWKVALVTPLNTHSRKGLRAGGRQQPVYPQY